MRQRKTRGHSRLHHQLKEWAKNQCAPSNGLSDILDKHQRNWAKVRHVWGIDCGRDSARKHPGGLTRKLILQSLHQIYQAWKRELDARNEPYYLKIWLHEPWIEESQVVCAIGDYLHCYDKIFDMLNEDTRPSSLASVPELKTIGNWQAHLHSAEYYEEEWSDDPTMMEWLRERDFPTKEVTLNEGSTEKIYIQRLGRVFVGG